MRHGHVPENRSEIILHLKRKSLGDGKVAKQMTHLRLVRDSGIIRCNLISVVRSALAHSNLHGITPIFSYVVLTGIRVTWLVKDRLGPVITGLCVLKLHRTILPFTSFLMNLKLYFLVQN